MKSQILQLKTSGISLFSVSSSNFIRRIATKYSIFRKSTNLPALVFLRLFGTSIINKITNINRTESINNYFRLHFNLYLKTISRLEQMLSHREQSQNYLYPETSIPPSPTFAKGEKVLEGLFTKGGKVLKGLFAKGEKVLEVLFAKREEILKSPFENLFPNVFIGEGRFRGISGWGLGNYVSCFKNVSLYPRNILQQALYIRDVGAVSKTGIVSLRPTKRDFTRDDRRERLALTYTGMLPLIPPLIQVSKTISRLEQMLSHREQSQNYLYPETSIPLSPTFAKGEKVLKGLFTKGGKVLKGLFAKGEKVLEGLFAKKWEILKPLFEKGSLFSVSVGSVMVTRDPRVKNRRVNEGNTLIYEGGQGENSFPNVKNRLSGLQGNSEWQISKTTQAVNTLFGGRYRLTPMNRGVIFNQAMIKNVLWGKIANKYLQISEMKRHIYKTNTSILKRYGDLSPDMIYPVRNSIYQDSISIVQEKVLSDFKKSINNIAYESKGLILRKPTAQSADIVSENKEGLQTEKTITTKISDSVIKDSFKTEGIYEINAIADKVYNMIEKRISIEKERRGWR